MDKDKLNDVFTVALGLVSILAIVGVLINNEFETNEVLGGVVDLSQILIPILVLVVANTMRRENTSFCKIGKDVLVDIQKRFPRFLMGPRYNRDNYDPEKGMGMEYFFVTNSNPASKKRVKFVPVNPLDEGVLAIYVQKGTLVYGMNYTSEKATTEEIGKIKDNVYKAVIETAENKYAGFFEEIKNDKGDSAIIIDFDEEKMGKKRFAKAVEQCVTTAVETLIKNRK